jgi:hypothetical protein
MIPKSLYSQAAAHKIVSSLLLLLLLLLLFQYRPYLYYPQTNACPLCYAIHSHELQQLRAQARTLLLCKPPLLACVALLLQPLLLQRVCARCVRAGMHTHFPVPSAHMNVCYSYCYYCYKCQRLLLTGPADCC